MANQPINYQSSHVLNDKLFISFPDIMCMDLVFKRYFRKFALIIFAIIIIIQITCPVEAIKSTQFDVDYTTQAYSYGKYVPRWDNVYKPNEKIKLYLAIKDINVGRAAAVDFVYVITDPNGYVVDSGEQLKHHIGYEDRLFDVLEIETNKSWIPGKYQLDLYVFDVLNLTGTYSQYSVLPIEAPFTGEADVGITLESRIKSEYLIEHLEFYIDSTPPETPKQLLVFDSYLRAKELPQGLSNFLHVKVLNQIDKRGEGTLELIIDGKSIETKKISLNGYQSTDVNFEIPPLGVGVHIIELKPRSETIELIQFLPTFVSPLTYKGDILEGSIYNGSIVYSPNNYVLGSIGISEVKNIEDIDSSVKVMGNKEDAQRSMKMVTNIIAFLWTKYNRGGSINVALLDGSDTRAKKVLPGLLEMVKRDSGAPVTYVGVKGYNNLDGVSVLFYVGSKAPDVKKLESFFRSGGFLIIDNTAFWSSPLKQTLTDLKYVKGWGGFEKTEEVYNSYYDLFIDKVITITVREEVRIPTDIQFLNLKISQFIVDIGNPVDISFGVKNEGKTGEREIRVYVNDEVAYESRVTLNTGEQKILGFKYTPEEEGSYKVSIEGTDLVEVFFAKVKEEEREEQVLETPVEEQRSRQGGEFVIASALILGILIIARMLMRE